jgi:glutamine phosphoribosylpyrophosphate amidotransferase
MLNSMPLPKENFCTACFTGEYPSSQSCHCSKNALEV